MYRSIWKQCHKSVCQLSFFSSDGINLISMTGFKVNGQFLITDDYLFKIYKAAEVSIRFMDADGCTQIAGVRIPMSEFKKRILKGIEKDKTPFAAININFDEFRDIPSLKLKASDQTVEIGQPIAVLGFQLHRDNLSIKTGILASSFIENNGLKYYHINSSIKQGNSGSPIVNAETGEVIGVLGHKLASITQSHKRMKQIINNNLAILKKNQGKFNVEEIDPVQVLIANQNQIKYIANEIYKTATMSDGYALDTKYVHDLFEEFVDAEVSQSSETIHIGN